MSAVAHVDRYKTGEFYTDEYRGELSWNGYEHNVLLRNEIGSGELRFSDVSMAAGLDDIKDARGMSTADFDNDGDLDVVSNSNVGDKGLEGISATLMRNDVGQSRSWLAVELEGTRSNRDAIGAMVTIETASEPEPTGGRGKGSSGRSASRKQLRYVTAGSGYASQHSDRLYFGLGSATRIVKLKVRWPGGGTETFEDIASDQCIRITEPRKLERIHLPSRRNRTVSESTGRHRWKP